MENPKKTAKFVSMHYEKYMKFELIKFAWLVILLKYWPGFHKLFNSLVNLTFSKNRYAELTEIIVDRRKIKKIKICFAVSINERNLWN